MVRSVCELTGRFVVILLYGPPGCGKGTQSEYISSRFAIPAISTGDMLRADFTDGSATSVRVKTGILVEDDLVNGMVAERLAEPDCQDGFLLDGYPRTVPQALFLHGLVAEQRLPEPLVPGSQSRSARPRPAEQPSAPRRSPPAHPARAPAVPAVV